MNDDMPEGLEKNYGKSANGAMRASIGTKIKVNLVPYELQVMAALGLNYGADKYEPRNFEKGLSALDLTESIRRHNDAFQQGEDIDADSGLPHIALIASSVAMLCHNWMQGVMVEDRPVPKYGKTISALAELGKKLENTGALRREMKKQTGKQVSPAPHNQVLVRNGAEVRAEAAKENARLALGSLSISNGPPVVPHHNLDPSGAKVAYRWGA